MNLIRLLQYFLPLGNPLGFGLADAILLAIALLLVIAILQQGRVAALLDAAANRPAIACAALFALPVGMRLLLLPLHPVPDAGGADGFSFLLLGDTLAHFRLANPTHPMHRFFETAFVLQEPSYSSIYPPGQGIVLALGQWFFHLPWAGVLLSAGCIAPLVFWMLRGWISPRWALLGGLLAVAQFGPLNQWMNTYWGGAVPALAGCLVFGGLPRILDRGRTRDAALVGVGLGLHAISRPFETVGLALCVLLFSLPLLRRSEFRKLAGCCALAALPFGLLTLAHNKAVTTQWFTLPYEASRTQYGVPATLAFQSNPQPSRHLTFEQRIIFEGQAATHGTQPETFSRYLARLVDRIRFLRFFLAAPLWLALFFAVPLLRRFRYACAAASLLLLVLQSNLYVYYYPHYNASAACLILLFAVSGLERLSTVRFRNTIVGTEACRAIVILVFGQFALWYGVHLFGNLELLRATASYEGWDYINFGDPEGRTAVREALNTAPGQQLVFVRYSPSHLYREWLHNDALIDQSRVVRALDLGPSENETLIRYYPNRTVWLLQPDSNPPRLTRYAPQP